MPTFGSLFAGIGGIDLGLERAGWTGRWQVEWDEYCQRVLAKHWPDIPRYGDITTVDWSSVEPVDLIAGGFPCQPWSSAGKRRGLDDDRWLWPEFERAVRELRPRYVLVENVPGLLVGGGMDAVLGGLARLGYDTEWESIPAAAVGAPHLRYRVWIIAYANRHEHEGDAPPLGRAATSVVLADDDRRDRRASGAGEAQAGAAGHAVVGGPSDAERPAMANSDNARLQGFAGPVLPEREAPDGHGGAGGVGDPDGASTDALAARRRSRRAASEPGWWATEPDVGRVAHGVPARVDRLRSLGNAVVPQVVQVIGERLIECLRQTS